MSFEIFGFMGRSQSGKDLCGDYVARHYKFSRLALADVLKRFAGTVFPFDKETHLWGPSRYRNEKVQVNWTLANLKLRDNIVEWVDQLPLTFTEKASYKSVLFDWFNHCETFSVEDGGYISARVVLQLLGTEYGRAFKDSLWVDYVFDYIVPRLKAGAGRYHAHHGICGAGIEGKGVVLTDLRFVNELEAVKKRGGTVIRLIRLAQEGEKSGADKSGLVKHQSEEELQSIPLDSFDVVLRMEEGVDLVEERLKKMMGEEEWKAKT